MLNHTFIAQQIFVRFGLSIVPHRKISPPVLFCSVVAQVISRFIPLAFGTAIPHGFCGQIPSSTATQNAVVFRLIFLPDRCRVTFRMFRINFSQANLLVYVPKLYCAANLFSVFHDFSIASVFSCLREKTLNRSNILLFFSSENSLQVTAIYVTSTSEITSVVCLRINVLCTALSSKNDSTLPAFFLLFSELLPLPSIRPSTL